MDAPPGMNSMDRVSFHRLQSILRFQSRAWLRRVRATCGRTGMSRLASAVLTAVGSRALAAASEMRARTGSDEANAALKLLERLPLRTRDSLRSAFLAVRAGRRHPEYSDRLLPGMAPSEIRAIALYRWSATWDWQAVAAAGVRFVGHRQPRIPGKFGFYPKTDHDLAVRHARLASDYGIHAFCIPARSAAASDGVTAAELLRLLNDPDLTLRLCVLFDLAPDAASAAAWDEWRDVLTHPRYLQAAGGPLVLVTGSHVGTGARLSRAMLAEIGVADAHLVAVSAEPVADGGYDGIARLSLAPAAAPVQPVLLDAHFRGALSRYADDARWLLGDDHARPPFYPTVMAGMDDSPLVGERARICTDPTPSKYASALAAACARARSRTDRPSFVFLNAWNDWLRGAVLEPDADTGFAYLERTRRVLEQFSSGMPDGWRPDSREVAVIVHLHYTELWPEISGFLANVPAGFKLYVSVNLHAPAECETEILASFPHAVVERLENRGRDLYPFLHMLARARADGCRFVCKLHSKKSLHRVDGDVWRRDLFGKLLGSEPGPLRILHAMQSRPSVGMIGPEGHMVLSDRFRGSNDARVRELAASLGFDAADMRYRFAAGTMFWARMEALEPLLGLGLNRDSFDEENGQTDGTLAHALERLLPLSARRAGMSVIDTGEIAGGSHRAAAVSEDGAYRWAQSSRNT
ncbi:rhamnan synthesis F family protein [Caballeronia sp. M1242]|uniref:rhamnan synthesis F family protein n=1 Tax=Caballeronia sp. M1242 TaxID=2814653 RepID=UPI0019D3074A|nr:rhamnan synthesis F family protein [Caballeronia sp. M1242]QSN60693.1 glycoside hydrolase family 99-like domain-containing protein [Caballeronia sp. M1242]